MYISSGRAKQPHLVNGNYLKALSANKRHSELKE